MNELETLRLVAQYGACFSEDLHTQNGAALAHKTGPLVMSANRFPAGVKHRTTRPEKYAYIEHAERSVIYKAAKSGLATAGATMYCPWFSCPECARAIVMAGIREVVGSAVAAEATPYRWRKQIVDGTGILREGGVGVRWLAGKLGVSILFDGKVLEL